MEGERKTLEGESPLLKDGALSLQTSLSHRELPPCPRHLRSEDLFRFSRVAGTWGKFFVDLGGMNLLQSAASRSFCVGAAIGRAERESARSGGGLGAFFAQSRVKNELDDVAKEDDDERREDVENRVLAQEDG